MDNRNVLQQVMWQYVCWQVLLYARGGIVSMPVPSNAVIHYSSPDIEMYQCAPMCQAMLGTEVIYHFGVQCQAVAANTSTLHPPPCDLSQTRRHSPLRKYRQASADGPSVTCRLTGEPFRKQRNFSFAAFLEACCFNQQNEQLPFLGLCPVSAGHSCVHWPANKRY